jgi:hypothetical protein
MFSGEHRGAGYSSRIGNVIYQMYTGAITMVTQRIMAEYFPQGPSVFSNNLNDFGITCE